MDVIDGLRKATRDKYGMYSAEEMGVDAISYFFGYSDEENPFSKDNLYKFEIFDKRKECEEFSIFCSEFLFDEEGGISSSLEEPDYKWIFENIYPGIVSKMKELGW